MAKKSLLDSIDVPAPCPKKWDEMIGDDKVRLCGSCDKNIYNISEMTRAEVRKLLFQSKEKICIRLEKDRDGRVQTLKKQFHKITRQAPIAAGVLSASLTFSALTYAQGDIVIGTTSAIISNKHEDNTSIASISGIITDKTSVVIPGAAIILRDTKNNSIRNTVSNDDGFYEFKNVEKSDYEIEFVGAGFKKSIYHNLVVGNDKNIQLKIILESYEPTDGDLVANDDKPIETTERMQINNSVERQKLESLPAQRNLPVLGLFPGTRTTRAKSAANKHQNKTSQISFTIYDTNGEAVPNQTVELTDQMTKEKFTVSTDRQGVAQFSSIPRGVYDIEVTGNGFNRYKQIVQIKEQVEPNIKITLEVGTAIGDFAVDWSEIPMFRAIAQDDNGAVKQQVNQGFDVDTKDKSGETALHVAVQHGNLEIVRFLLDNGAKVNIKDKAKRLPTAMVFDSFEDDEAKMREIIRLLVSKGADINVRDDGDSKQTLLMKAAEDDSVEAVKFFLELGANPNLKDEDGETAMQKTDSDEIKQLLKRYGARE